MSQSRRNQMNAVARNAWQHEPRPTETVVLHFAADKAPCRCVTHQLAGIQATSVAWRPATRAARFMLRCLRCGRAWSKVMQPGERRP